MRLNHGSMGTLDSGLDHAMDWTVDWTQDEEFCGLLNSLQVAGGKEPGACSLKIAIICMHATLRGGLVTMAVSGPVMYLVPWACQGLILFYWGSYVYARVED